MISRHWTRGAPWIGLALAAVIGGCNKPRNAGAGGAETGAAGGASTMDTATTAPAPGDTGSMSTGVAGAKLTDANIVALLDEANKSDSAAGAVAATKGTSADVKKFAKLMMTEHHALRLQGEQLAKKLKVTPEMPAEDPVSPMAQQEMSTLQSTPKGGEFDRAYINQEVTVHKAVKDLLDKAKGDAENQELKALIGKAQPVIQEHLDKAEAIQKKLSPSA